MAIYSMPFRLDWPLKQHKKGLLIFLCSLALTTSMDLIISFLLRMVFVCRAGHPCVTRQNICLEGHVVFNSPWILIRLCFILWIYRVSAHNATLDPLSHIMMKQRRSKWSKNFRGDALCRGKSKCRRDVLRHRKRSSFFLSPTGIDMVLRFFI